MPAGSQDLVRSARSFFRHKGEALDVIPVVVIDDNSLGPYPPCRVWYAAAIVGPIAAQYAYGWITNEDGVMGQIAPTGPGKSAVVIDEIYVKTTTLADDYLIAVSRKGSIAVAIGAIANDACQVPEQDLVTNPRIGNVTVGQTNQSGVLTAGNHQVFPGGALGVVTRIPGPFVLPPQGLLSINPYTLANSMVVAFRGRYYPAI